MNSAVQVISRVKFEAICPTAKALLKLGHATEKLPEVHQQIYKRIEKNEGVAMAQ